MQKQPAADLRQAVLLMSEILSDYLVPNSLSPASPTPGVM